jgi:hypothetical protein
MNSITNVVISGYTRSGSTYLFNVLKSSGHFSLPINNIKELRYFIDDEYHINGMTNTKPYISFFKLNKNLTLESSPDYIHNKVFVQEFSKNKNLKTIIIKRPLDSRLNSWYNYSKAKKLINTQISFEQFKKNQVQNQDSFNKPSYYSVISNMTFRNNLERLLEIDNSRVLIINFEDLTKDFKKIQPVLSEFLNCKIYCDSNINYPKNSYLDVSFLNSIAIFRKIKHYVKRNFHLI